MMDELDDSEPQLEDEEYLSLQAQMDQLFQDWNANIDLKNFSLHNQLHDSSQNYNDCLAIAEKTNVRCEHYLSHTLADLAQLKDADVLEDCSDGPENEEIQLFKNGLLDTEQKLHRCRQVTIEKLGDLEQLVAKQDELTAERINKRTALSLEICRKQAYIQTACDLMGISFQGFRGKESFEVKFTQLGEGTVSEAGMEVDVSAKTVKNMWPVAKEKNGRYVQDLNECAKTHPFTKVFIEGRRMMKEQCENMNFVTEKME